MREVPTGSERKVGGFTAMEVVAVLVIVGILAVAMAAGMRVNAEVAAEAGILRTHLRYTQSLAMANNTAEWGVLFTAQGYTLRRRALPGGAWGDAPLPFPGENSAVHLLPTGVGITAGAGLLVLNSWGAPAANWSITLSDGARQQTVSMLGFTGLVP